jgi:hypothetical protein
MEEMEKEMEEMEEMEEWRRVRGFLGDSANLLPSLLFQNVFEG